MKRRLHVLISMVSKKDKSTFCFYLTNQAFLSVPKQKQNNQAFLLFRLFICLIIYLIKKKPMKIYYVLLTICTTKICEFLDIHLE